jgi:hypothetical protein
MGANRMAADYVNIDIGDIGSALKLLANVYPDARRALAEFVSNSADAFSITERSGIWRDWVCKIILDERKGNITVVDNASGISYEELLKIPTRVALSSKSGDLETKGHKAIGLLAFASFCERMTIVSRAEGNKETYRAEWSQDSLKDPKRFPVRIELETKNPRRSTGTDVHLERIFKDKIHQLKKQKIIEFLKADFSPDLREKKYELFIIDGEDKIKIEPGKYSGVPFIRLKLETIKKEPIDLDLYISQKPGFQRVGLFIRGKQVIEDISTCPDFQNHPWTSGQIVGEIKCNFLKPITGRTGGIEPGEEWLRFVTAIRSIEQELATFIEKILEDQKEKQAHRIFKELNQALSYAIAKLKWDELPKSLGHKDGDGEHMQGGSGGVGSGSGGIGSGEKDKHLEKDKHSPLTPRLPRLIDPNKVRQRGAKRGPVFNWREVEFEPDAINLRSRYVPPEALIEINSVHEDYISEREKEDSHRNYLIRLAAKELTLINFRDMGDTEVTERMVQLETALMKYFKK